MAKKMEHDMETRVAQGGFRGTTLSLTQAYMYIYIYM